MWLACDHSRPGPSGGRLPAPLDNRCDLALFGELGNKYRSVLVVNMRLQFVFRKTVDQFDLAYTWSPGEKEAFARDSIAAIKAVWDDQFRITTTSTVPDEEFRDIGVIFDLSIQVGGVSIAEDYEFKVKKVGPFDRDGSHVQHKKHRGQLDSRGALPRLQRTTATGLQIYQQPVAHEFGHMLGLRDEYPEANAPNPNWKDDLLSILHTGAVVRPRHYVPFATWLTQKYARQSQRAGVTTTFKVQGPNQRTWDETNAML